MKNYNPAPPRVAAAPAGSVKATGAGSRKSRSFTHEEISTRAHALWEQRGRPLDQDEAIWLAAERRMKDGEEADFADPKALLNKDGDPSSRLEDRLREEVTPPERRSATSL